MFKTLYEKTLFWAAHPKADRYLATMSFAESSFFPIPPDVMLMPMSLARPEKAFYFAWLTTLFSVLGGLLGYAIGFFAMDWLEPHLIAWGYGEKMELAKQFFAEYGVWIVFIAGFSPIPYKVFTITAGANAMALVPFLIASFVGRGLRFYMVAALMKYGGAKIEPFVRRWVDWFGWSLVAMIALYLLYKLA